MAGDRREMGLYEVDEEGGLPALGMGMDDCLLPDGRKVSTGY